MNNSQRPNHPLGPLVEAGDRVQLQRSTPGVAYASWGTVERCAGLGSAFVRLDDGRRFRLYTRDLKFAKMGRPALEQKGEVNMSTTATPHHDEPPHMRDPTDLELKISALGISDDVSFYVFRDAAIQSTGNGNWEEEYNDWATEWLGFVPHRVKNLGENNTWGYPPGPACCQNLPPFPPFLFQWQIDALNNCADFTTTVMAGEKYRQQLQAAGAKIREKLGPPRQPK